MHEDVDEQEPPDHVGEPAARVVRLIRSKRTPPRPEAHRAAFRQRFAPESVGFGNKLVRDALASRAQASFFYAIIFYVSPALREHEDDAQDSPELEAKAMVVDQSHHDFAQVSCRTCACRESGDSETITLARPVTSFRNFRTGGQKIVLD